MWRGGEGGVEGRRDRHAALIHATPHEIDPRELGDPRDPARGADAAALHELDIEDPARPWRRREREGVALGKQTFIGGDPAAHRLGERGEGLGLGSGDRLLHELQIQILGLLEEARHLIPSIALIGIDADPDAAADPLAELAQPLQVGVEVAANLHLEDAKAARDVFLGFVEGGAGLLDADRDRRRELLVRARRARRRAAIPTIARGGRGARCRRRRGRPGSPPSGARARAGARGAGARRAPRATRGVPRRGRRGTSPRSRPSHAPRGRPSPIPTIPSARITTNPISIASIVRNAIV